MKNNFLIFFLTLFYGINFLNISIAQDQFKFNITEIEISDNGNLIIGSKGGKAETYNGHEITAKNFVYNKSKNILNVEGNVKFIDHNINLTVFSDKATYLKNNEIIFTDGNSKAISQNNIITSSNFNLDIAKNILVAEKKVKYLDNNNEFIILSNKAIYNKNDETIFTEGDSIAVYENYKLTALNFKFDRVKNILNADKNVKLNDNENKINIYSDKATYQKNKEIILTKGNSKAIDNNNTITASNFKFDRVKNILTAENKVKFEDKKKDTIINSDKVTYLKKKEIILTESNTTALVENKYNFSSTNVKYDKNKNQISSQNNSKIFEDNGNIYKTSNFLYQIDKKILKGKNVNIISQVDKNKKDNYFFSEGFFNFGNKKFITKETNINIHKDIFGNNEQDPRLYGSSSFGDDKTTIINKGIFTSCKINDNCPPWSIQSEKITHDKIKKDLIYKNAVLKIYDFPVLYFPKFFHPDPTVKRRTGFLQPQFNRSKTLGSSIYLPYFKTFGFDKDYTFKPTFFENKDGKQKTILQNEFRRKKENSYLIADFGLTKGYKSPADNKKKNINHLFVKYEKNLNLPEFLNSNMDLKIERVNNDTYLKVFQNNLFPSPVMPNDKNLMSTKLTYDFDHKNYNLSTGFQIYEKLGTKHSDRYQYVLPSYNFSKNLKLNNLNGSANFYSSGSNNLKNTNNLRTSVTNDLEYNSINYITNNGLKNNFNLYFKNLNSVGKNDTIYKSSPSVEGMSIFEVSSSLPLIKKNTLSKETLTPRISVRANPGNNMKNHSTSNKLISANDIFAINRLGISDSFEAGKSVTLGLNYKLDYINDNKENDKFFEFKLATVLRDKVEKTIPKTSTIDKKNSNLFGSINNNLFNNVNLTYDFTIDNDLQTFESHSLNSEITINNFITQFNYIEQRNEVGSNHILTNKTSYNFDENNSLSFSTRRNKEISLTEYYDFSYEYKNDCLTAALKFNKTFYKDNDLIPEENLFFSLTLIPLTTYERRIYERTN